MLSVLSFGMVSNPQAERGVADMRPRNAEAKFLMDLAKCAVWCSSSWYPWDTKCSWGSGDCSACAECTDVSTSNCGSWCDIHSECNWSEHVCSGCTDCQDAANVPVACDHWCAGNGADWSFKCQWPEDHCSGCSQCAQVKK